MVCGRLVVFSHLVVCSRLVVCSHLVVCGRLVVCCHLIDSFSVVNGSLLLSVVPFLAVIHDLGFFSLV